MKLTYKILLGVCVVAAVTSGVWLLVFNGDNGPKTTTTSTLEHKFDFQNPKKSAHYESNTPAHGSVLAGAPINVVIDFNFDLAKPSAISITSGNKEFGTGDTIIDQNKLTLRRTVKPQAPDGLYTVSYNACWPDRSCHDGSFQFAIQRSDATSYTDLRGPNEVTINMSDIKFNPANIRISKGTKVIWVNKETVGHFVNSDSHPAHTYMPRMNSRTLTQGASYSFTFNQNGTFPYHCSAHADDMNGTILVEET